MRFKNLLSDRRSINHNLVQCDWLEIQQHFLSSFLFNVRKIILILKLYYDISLVNVNL